VGPHRYPFGAAPLGVRARVLAFSALHETAKDTARWSYNHGDGEASFWMT
jgi:hypothetical protein